MPKKTFDIDTEVTQASQSSSMPEGARDDPEIEKIFDRVISDCWHDSNFEEFIYSLYDWWEEKGWLTAKQYEALRNADRRL